MRAVVNGPAAWFHVRQCANAAVLKLVCITA